MPLDPNLILGAQAPVITNPMDMYTKALTMKQLAQHGQLQDQEIAANTAVKDAYNKNTSIGPDGTPTLNPQGAMSTLMQNGYGKQALDLKQTLQAQSSAKAEADMKMLKDRHEMASDIAFSIPTDPSVPLEQKQAAWATAKQKAIQAGLPGADQSPDQYPGDTFVKGMQMHTLTAQQQTESAWKQKEFDQKQQDLQIKRQEMGNTKQNQAMDSVGRQLESARGNPAAAQAEKDLYAAQKFDSLINLYGDPNKLNPAQVQLAATEVAKIASGGVPTSHELQGLNPSAIPSGLAALAQKVANHPEGAEAGAFLKGMQDYTNSLKGDAQKVIQDKYGRVIEANKDRLGDKNYGALQDQYINRFKKGGGLAPPTTVQMKAPDGSIRAVSVDQVDAAKAAGGQAL